LRKSAQERSRSRNAIAPADDTLWQALRETRLALSKELGVPPYVIFHDATLQEMLTRKPTTLDGMRGISGVGERKLAKFGEEFLNVLREHAPNGA
jgi:ATP-dependent DNA helicase RecQ